MVCKLTLTIVPLMSILDNLIQDGLVIMGTNEQIIISVTYMYIPLESGTTSFDVVRAFVSCTGLERTTAGSCAGKRGGMEGQ